MEKLLCPSMMCADYGCLAEEIKARLDAAGIEEAVRQRLRLLEQRSS